MADVAFIRLTDYQDKHPVILAISRIISVCPVLDFEDASGVGVMVATRIEYDNDGGDTPLVRESFDEVAAVIAKVAPVASASAPAVPPPSLPEFDESTTLRDLRDCGLLNGHSFFPLARAGVKTVGDLVTCDRTFIFNLRGIGPVGRRKIEDIMSRFNGKVGS
jgi:hypothetical protein